MLYRVMLRASLGLPLAAAALLAHHSTAPYDLTHPAVVKGVVTGVEWENPHAHIYLEARDEQGRVQEWTIEIESPNFLTRNGWTKNTVKAGDTIACSGARAKNGANLMRCNTVELADGRKLDS
jgi:hypothetical protein